MIFAPLLTLDTVHVLFGSNYYLDVIPPYRLEVQTELSLLKSRFGWIMTGRTNEYDCDIMHTSMLILTHGNAINNSSVDRVVPVKADLVDIWKLKSLGISKPVILKIRELWKKFMEILLFEIGKYTVTCHGTTRCWLSQKIDD